MSASDLCFVPAGELLRLYRARKVSPLEVMRAVLARIDALNPKLNAYVTLARESALAEAKKAYSKTVHDNNGIKEANLIRLLLPVGLRESQFPQGFLPDMETFGTRRGDHALADSEAPSPTGCNAEGLLEDP